MKAIDIGTAMHAALTPPRPAILAELFSLGPSLIKGKVTQQQAIALTAAPFLCKSE